MPRAKFEIRRKASLKAYNITWECRQRISVGGAVRKEILSSQYDSSVVLMTLARAHNRDTKEL